MNNTDSGQSDGSDAPRLRVALLPANFDPRLSYLENNFAQGLHEMGHEVMVFTTSPRRGDADGSLAALDVALPYRVVRSSRVLRIRHTQIPYDWTMRRRILEFDPQVAFILGPNHGTGYHWMKLLPPGCRKIVGFSDLSWHRGRLSAWVKGRWARRAIRRADKVFTATLDTRRLVQEWAGPEDAGRVEHIGLSFLPAALEGCEAPPAVTALSGRVKQLIVSITRVSPGKRLDAVFKAVEQYLTVHADAGLAMGGFDDGVESQRLRGIIAASPVADRCVVLPLLSPAEIGAVFRMAACSLWSTVSIGIYHSLHCGCPVLVREGQDASHLLASPAAGAWFGSDEQITPALERQLGQHGDRAAASAIVAPYHAWKVLARLLQAPTQ